jgi:DNA-binding transcriptional LysR family regulator
MILDGIDVFAEVVEAKSFSRAAARLGMPTSTVSAKVARLEDRLGVTLLRRTTRRLDLTPAGQGYYDRCVRALAELSDAERELTELTEDPAGPLRITAPADLTQMRLAPLVGPFLARHPRVSVDLIVTNRRVDLIAEGIDLAVRIGKLRDSSMIARKFLDVRAGFWASRDYLARTTPPATVTDLRDHPLIGMASADSLVTLRDETGSQVPVDMTGRISTDDMLTCKTLIEAGAGIGLLPDFMAETSPGNTPLVRILPQLSSDPVTAYFLYPTQRFLPRPVRAFIDFALENTSRPPLSPGQPAR